MPCAWALSPAAAGRWRPGPCRPARGTLVSGPGGYSCLGGRGARPSLPRVSQIPRLKDVSGERCSPAPRGLVSKPALHLRPGGGRRSPLLVHFTSGRGPRGCSNKGSARDKPARKCAERGTWQRTTGSETSARGHRSASGPQNRVGVQGKGRSTLPLWERAPGFRGDLPDQLCFAVNRLTFSSESFQK